MTFDVSFCLITNVFELIQVIAAHLSVEEVAGMQEVFELMDTGRRGRIGIDELKVGLRKVGHQISDTDVQILMDAVRTIVVFS